MIYRIIGVILVILIVVIAALWKAIDERSKDVQQLSRFAAAGNSQTPRMIDSVTRLDSVSVEFPAVVFHYTVLMPASEVDVAKVKENNIRWFRVHACDNAAVIKSVLEPGYKIVRSYEDIDENHIFRMTLGSGLCSENT